MTETYGVVDADIHPTAVENLAPLLPYMDATWRRLLEPRSTYSFMQIAGRSARFNEGLLRKDATPPNGGSPGSDPAYVGKHHLDRHGIEIGLLIPLGAGRVNTFTNPDEAAVVASASNDFFLNEWLSVDERFRLAMTVSPLDPLLAAQEIRRIGATDGVSAVFLPLINQLLGHRYFFPIYEAAQELGLPIVLHPDATGSTIAGCVEYAGGIPSTPHEKYVLLNQFAMSNLASMIFEGTFERFPRLKVVLTEYGWTWVPSLLWRLDSTWKMGRKAAPWLKKSPTEYVLESVRFTTEPAIEAPSERETMQMVEMMHGDRTLIFSSDYPHYDADEDPAMIFKSASPEAKRRILRDNAVDTFGERLGLRQPAVT
jgi:predicted TIM-barrel fold metal-dependent hydrolase